MKLYRRVKSGPETHSDFADDLIQDFDSAHHNLGQSLYGVTMCDGTIRPYNLTKTRVTG